jgi:hypothetical protein
MAHFAELDDNNKVIRVIVVNNNELLDNNGNENEQLGIDFCTSLFGGRWVQTSYTGSIRKNFAATGYTYDPDLDAFIKFKPYTSWTLNTETCEWEAPTPYPVDNKKYLWNEDTVAWEIENVN